MQYVHRMIIKIILIMMTYQYFDMTTDRYIQYYSCTFFIDICLLIDRFTDEVYRLVDFLIDDQHISWLIDQVSVLKSVTA